jgi:hypothetical protein
MRIVDLEKSLYLCGDIERNRLGRQALHTQGWTSVEGGGMGWRNWHNRNGGSGGRQVINAGASTHLIGAEGIGHDWLRELPGLLLACGALE